MAVQHSAPTLTQYLIEQRRRHPTATGQFNALILDVAQACKAISRAVAHGSLGGMLGNLEPLAAIAPPDSACGQLDALANDIFLRTTEWAGTVGALASDCSELPVEIPAEYPKGKYLLVYVPLDGAAESDVDALLGSIFSVLRVPENGSVTAADFLQPGVEQVAAGYAIYGPATQFVLTVGNGVVGFTLDPLLGDFFLTHADMRIPEETAEFAIDASNSRFWEPPIKRYVEECLAGSSGPRSKEFQLRWIASSVAETHRILIRGGVFLNPSDSRRGKEEVRPRLLLEANPLAMIVEQAGGRASTGQEPVLGVVPTSLHERTGLVFGSSAEVERIERYYAEQHEPRVGNTYGSYFEAGEPRDTPERAADDYEELPLFNTRGLFRDTD